MLVKETLLQSVTLVLTVFYLERFMKPSVVGVYTEPLKILSEGQTECLKLTVYYRKVFVFR